MNQSVLPVLTNISNTTYTCQKQYKIMPSPRSKLRIIHDDDVSSSSSGSESEDNVIETSSDNDANHDEERSNDAAKETERKLQELKIQKIVERDIHRNRMSKLGKIADIPICEEEENDESLSGEVNVLPVVEVDEVSTEIDNNLDEKVKGIAKEDIDKDEVAKVSDNSICDEKGNEEKEEVVPVEDAQVEGSLEKSLSSEVNVLPVVEGDEVSTEIDNNLGITKEKIDKDEVAKISDNSICEEKGNEKEEVVPVEDAQGEGSVEKNLSGEVNVLPVVEADQVYSEIDNNLDGNGEEAMDKEEVAKFSDNSICKEEDNEEREEIISVEDAQGEETVEKSLSNKTNILPVVDVNELSQESAEKFHSNAKQDMENGEIAKISDTTICKEEGSSEKGEDVSEAVEKCLSGKTDVLYEGEVDELSLESDENVDSSNEQTVESKEETAPIELISPALVEEVAAPMKLISPDPVSRRIDSKSEIETTTSSEPGCTFSFKKLKEFVPEKSSIKWSERERYLKENEFEQIFSITKEEFQKLPKWRQVLKKKEVGLF